MRRQGGGAFQWENVYKDGYCVYKLFALCTSILKPVSPSSRTLISRMVRMFFSLLRSVQTEVLLSSNILPSAHFSAFLFTPFQDQKRLPSHNTHPFHPWSTEFTFRYLMSLCRFPFAVRRMRSKPVNPSGRLRDVFL